MRLPQLPHAGVAALTAAALPLFGGERLFLGGCGAGVVHICSLEVCLLALVWHWLGIGLAMVPDMLALAGCWAGVQPIADVWVNHRPLHYSC